MKAILEIDMGNAAFEDNPAELSRIMRELADKVEATGIASVGDDFVARDFNGNRVGCLNIVASGYVPPHDPRRGAKP